MIASGELPEVRAVFIGRGLVERFTVDAGDGCWELLSDLAFLADAGVKIIGATNPDWPPDAMLVVDERGRYHEPTTELR